MAHRPERYHAIIDWPLGRLGIVADTALTRIDFLPDGTRTQRATTALARDTQRQLRAYFRAPTHRFDIPLGLHGTDFQRRVWQAMRRIPRGRVVSYGELAQRLASGARAVGGACGANPVPIVVPCHRVVAANGLGGYSGGDGHNSLDIKRWLLQHERA